MDRDLLIMMYGAIMGIAGSIVTSLVTTIFQFWLQRREYERRQSEEKNRQLRHIYLPTDQEVIVINSQLSEEEEATESARKPAPVGYIVVSVVLSSALIDQTNDPMLSLAFAAMLGILIANRVIRFIKR